MEIIVLEIISSFQQIHILRGVGERAEVMYMVDVERESAGISPNR